MEAHFVPVLAAMSSREETLLGIVGLVKRTVLVSFATRAFELRIMKVTKYFFIEPRREVVAIVVTLKPGRLKDVAMLTVPRHKAMNPPKP